MSGQNRWGQPKTKKDQIRHKNTAQISCNFLHFLCDTGLILDKLMTHFDYKKIANRVLHACFLAAFSIGMSAHLSPAQAQNLTVSQTTTDKKFVPQGNKIAMIYIKLQANLADMTFTSMRFKNASSQVFFGQHITRALLYKDSLNSQQTVFDDGLEEEIARIDFPTPSTADQLFASFSQTIPSGNTQGYFIVYEISDTAPLSASTNIQLLDIGESNFNFGSNTVTNTATITGFAVKNITSIAPAVVIPGQAKVGMLLLELKMQGEGIDNGFQFTIANQGANFVSDASAQNGVTGVYLYKNRVDANSKIFDPLFLTNYAPEAQSVLAGQFTSASSVTFSFSGTGSFNLQDGVTTNLFVVYDIGNEIQVTTETKVYAQVTALSGKGTDSRVSININTASPQPAAQSLVAGLSFSELTNIVPSNVNFGQLSQIPMLKFQIQANHATINIKSISLQNPGNVPYITSTQDLKNIQSIVLYEDSNRDGVFNGSSVGLDTPIGNLQLGSGTNQQDRAVIPVVISNIGDLVVAPFDSNQDKTVGYNANNARMIFAIYSTGRFIEASASSTSNPFAVARLENVVGSTNISGKNFMINLSGTLPAAASPEASVTLQRLDLRLDSVTDISPESAVRGQTNVPMLAFTIESSRVVTSANITILNVGGTYNKFHQGVSKVLLYRDENINKVLDSLDTLLTTNDTLPNQSQVELSGIAMNTGLNHFLVLYDIGFLTPITAPGSANIVRSEFKTISATGSTFIFGGQSLEVAQVSVKDKPIRINTLVVNSLDQGTYLTTTFNVTMQLENTSATPIEITAFYPVVYQSSNLGGTDISSEFSPVLGGTLPITLLANTSANYTFATKHSRPITGGTARLDAYLQYKVNDSLGDGVLTRYLSQGGWAGASPMNPQISLQAASQPHAWVWPSYVKSASIRSSETSTPFVNNDAIPANSSLSIAFQYSGQNLDENSLVLQLLGTQLQKTASLSSISGSRINNISSYTYNNSTGILTVSDVGIRSGQLLLNVNDTDGNAMPSAAFDFQISADLKISDVLFFPNPYLRDKQNPLRIGFNITQPATVILDLYNHLGMKVHSTEKTFTSLGYNSILIDANETFMTSGMYLCRVSAKDITGKRSSAQTRLAVY
jgi:hypothetical protein